MQLKDQAAIVTGGASGLGAATARKLAAQGAKVAVCDLNTKLAEELARVNSDLVVRDAGGKPYTVRYDAVNAMLLNEFLKEHRKVQYLEDKVAQQREDFEITITELKKEMKAVTARSKEQASQIQKVSAQLAAANPSRGGLEVSRPLPQLAHNND